MAVLQILRGPDPGRVYPLEGDSIVLGRHPECNLVLESGAVSRQHARLALTEGRYTIEDLQSRNGTFVNGRPVVQPQILEEHDRIGICDILFVFHADPRDLAAVFASESGELSDVTATMIDDERSPENSGVMSRLDIAAGASSLRLEVNPEVKLRAMVEISQSLSRSVELGEILPRLLDSLFKIFGQADRGFIVLLDPVTGRLIPKAVKHRRQELAETVRISRTILKGVMASKEAILSADATADSRFDMAESIVGFHIRSMMCAPLVTSDGQVLGVIQIDTLTQRNGFSREDLDVLAGITCQAAFAIENAQLHEAALRAQAIKRELLVAHDVLRGFLPASAPRLDQYDFFDFYEPANQLGGDYYDYVPLSGGRLAVVVGDVSGKGIPASLLMAKLSADARYCLASEPRPADAVARLNRVFCNSGWEDRFVTLTAVVIDPIEHEATIVNAGHLPPLVRRGGEVREAVSEEQTQLPLGVERDVEYGQSTVPFAPGDMLALYTDGITEAMNENDDLYGFDRLYAQVVRETASAQATGKCILTDVKRFVGGRAQSDDMCLVCVGRASAAEKGS